jgi:predicted Zn-dependent peptidase
MNKYCLKNGLKIIHEKKPGNVVVVQVMVKVGSNNELPKEKGISHFLEHILFEGTHLRPTNKEISNEIEKIGGDFNAYTSNERTCFYIKVLKKHYSKAVEILADIMQNSVFKEEHVKKEINIVLKEIDMVHDEPGYYQWILLQNNLFQKHPCKNPTYGDKEIVKKLTRDRVIAYYKKHYVPNNMVISVVGNVKDWKQEIVKRFTFASKNVAKLDYPKEPMQKMNSLLKKRRKIANTYTCLGFKTVSRNHKDAFALEVLNGILGRGQSGRMFTEIRSKRGLAYDVGTQNVGEVSFGFFAVYATIDRKNVNLVRKVILQEIQRIKEISESDLKEAKDFVEGRYLLELDDAQKIADQLLFWEQVRDAGMMQEFLKNIKKVSVADMKRVIEKYFNKHTMVVIEGK